MGDLLTILQIKALISLHPIKGLTLLAMGLTAIELRSLPRPEDRAHILPIMEAHIFRASDMATGLQHRNPPTIPSICRLTGTRRQRLSLRRMNTLF